VSVAPSATLIGTYRWFARKALDGSVLLVGHSYAGAVITAAGADDPRVRALVYIAAIAPDKDESVGELFQASEPTGGVRPQIALDSTGSSGCPREPSPILLRRTRRKRTWA